MAEIIADLTVNGEAPPSRGRTPDAGALDKVLAVFKDKPTEWVDFSDVRTQTGLTKAKVRQVMLKTAKDRFESRAHPQHGRKVQWRMKQ